MDGLELARRIRQNVKQLQGTLMMLTSLDDQNYISQVRAEGVATILRKPITQSDLLDAILEALGQTGSVTPSDETDEAPTTRPLHILLAEDNLVNQQVATGLLQEQGHSVEIANNGVEALSMLQDTTFDLILMDVQMPELGGFETTALKPWQE